MVFRCLSFTAIKSTDRNKGKIANHEISGTEVANERDGSPWVDIELVNRAGKSKIAIGFINGWLSWSPPVTKPDELNMYGVLPTPVESISEALGYLAE